jgi:hypothetical protein
MTKIKCVLPAETAGTEITRFNALRHGVLSRCTVLPLGEFRRIPSSCGGACGRRVESGCDAVAGGRTYFPPLSSGGALVVRPWLRFQILLIEPDVQITRTLLSDNTSRLHPRHVASGAGA